MTIKYFGKICAKHPELEGARWKPGNCVGCARERMRRWRKSAPEKGRESRRKWRAANPEKCRAIDKRRYEKTKGTPRRAEQRREANKRYRAQHLDVVKASQARWWAANPAKHSMYQTRRRALKIASQPHLTAIERAQYQEFYDIAKARTAQTGVKWTVDHDVPLTRGGVDHPSNFVLLPQAINSAKSNRYANTMEFLLS